MTREELYTAIGGIRDELIERAETHQFKKKLPIARWGALAAGLVLLIGVGAGLRYFPIGGGAGGGGNEGRTYMSYAGPVFPLTTLEDAAGLTAEREVNYDFSPYASYEESYEDSKGEMHTYTRYDTAAIVTDGYMLSNATAEAVTVTALYPFAASLRSELPHVPTITVDGEQVTAEMHIGAYTGGFTGVLGGDESDTRRMNRSGSASWSDYAALLESGEYMADAFAAFPALDQPVVVYEISNPICTVEASNPTLNFETTIDYSRTTVLTYGTNGGRHDPDGGHLARHFSIPEEWEPGYGESVYLLVLGDDLTGYRLQGYADGGCDEGEEIEATATVTRYESTLSEMLRQFTVGYWDFVEADCLLDTLDADIFIGLCAEMMQDYGLFADDPIERYSFNDIETYFSETGSMGRVIYLSFPVTVPAGGSVAVTAAMTKEASIDFVGSLKDRNGYDMVTQLGSTLAFTAQYASIKSAELIEIADQNFGFDPANGITRVTLDPTQPHYWMDVRKKSDESAE